MARIQEHTMQNDFLDLQSRLEHLITYSSQLVFVSGDGMGKQLNFAQQFLSNQNELANIGYVDADKASDVITYRKKFIRQLVGPQRVDYSKPLTVLIPRLLKEKSQFILIAVTHAELLPDEFMQELWDLVLQNRFAKNRHHLNILVFGEKQWASKAKSWLPANSNNKPVLLANESVDRGFQESQNTSELEQLIATKRQQFSERVAAREKHYTVRSNVLSQWWMKLLLATVFFITFTGILLTQYVSVDQAKAFYASIFEGPLAERGVEQNSSLPITEEEKAESTVIDENKSSEITEVKPSFLHLADDQRRVVDWEDAVKSLPKVPVDVSSEPNEGTEEVTGSELLQEADTSDVSVEDATQEAIATTESTEDDYDYPVEDITSIEQLNALAGNDATPPLQESESPAASDDQADTVSTDNANAVEEQPLSEIDSTATLYTFDEVALLDLEAGRYLLQFSAMSTEEALNFYLQSNQLSNDVWIYKTQRFGGDWFVVLHNQAFESLDQANAAAQNLSLDAQPFAKSVANAQQEISLN